MKKESLVVLSQRGQSGRQIKEQAFSTLQVTEIWAGRGNEATFDPLNSQMFGTAALKQAQQEQTSGSYFSQPNCKPNYTVGRLVWSCDSTHHSSTGRTVMLIGRLLVTTGTTVVDNVYRGHVRGANNYWWVMYNSIETTPPKGWCSRLSMYVIQNI